jgi:murein L,D-transpeptidase YcbB/YkuD
MMWEFAQAGIFAGVFAIALLLSGSAQGLDIAGTLAASTQATGSTGDVRTFYDRRAFAPAWSGSAAARRARAIALNALAHAAEDGLEPADYAVAAEGRGEAAETQYEMALTASVLRFARDLRIGRLAPSSIDRDAGLPPQSFDAAAALNEALRRQDAARFFRDLAPPHPEYRRLRQAFARYRTLAQLNAWTPMPADARDYARNERAAAALWNRLAVEDTTLSKMDRTPEAIDAAIRRFQERNGLGADGRIGPKTLAALNTSPAARVQQIITNMERWRWMPRTFGSAHIEVNAADATLKVIDEGRVVLTSRIVAGKPSTRTPIFAATVVAVTVNPSWHIPPSIARNELWPKERAHSGYLALQNIVVEAGALRQLPGEGNALGRVKLEMPNRFNSYLHDTPARALFIRDDRHFSHGCMRVQEILPLASYALTRDAASGLERLNAAVAAGTTLRIPLDRPLSVFVLYWTAIAHDDGTVDFRHDVYGRDGRLLAALSGHRSIGRVAQAQTECWAAAS